LWRKAKNAPLVGRMVPEPPKPLKLARGGVLPGYAPGVDTVPAMLSPGEAVLVPEAVRMLGKDTILALNSIASRGRAGGSSSPRGARRGGFALGGIVRKDMQPAAISAARTPAQKPAAKPSGGKQGKGAKAEPGSEGSFTLDQVIAALRTLGTVAQAAIAAMTNLRNQLVMMAGQVRTQWAAISAITVTTVNRIRTAASVGFMTLRNTVVRHLVALANASRVQWFIIRQIAFNAWNGIRAHATAQLTMLLNAARFRLNGIRAYAAWAMNTMRAHTAWAMNAMRAHMAWAMNAMRAHTAWAMNAMRTHKIGRAHV